MTDLAITLFILALIIGVPTLLLAWVLGDKR